MMPSLTIFSDNGVLKGAIIPEPLDFKGLKKDSVFADYKFYTGFSNKDIQQQYEISKREAIYKALNVLNPEVFNKVFEDYTDQIVDTNEFVWPGSYEVREHWHSEKGGHFQVYHLSI